MTTSDPSTTAPRPALSVVIASLNGVAYLRACLDALARQTGAVDAEVIVADCLGKPVVDFVTASHPHVRLITFNERKSVPELRAAGILAARGDLVVMTEDHCVPADDWYQALVRSHAAHAQPAIGGAVDNAATERRIDWAVYFCEYSNYASPVPEGVVHDLPGPNVSYKRTALDEMRDMLEGGYWETFLHQRLESKGYQLWSDPAVKVWHKKHFTLRAFLDERFHYGRWFAGTRNEFASVPRRLFYLVFSLLLPPLILYRLRKRVSRNPAYAREFVKCLPLIALFSAAWALGEFVGYATGPGRSVLHLS